MVLRNQLSAYFAALLAALSGILIADGATGIAFGAIVGTVALVAIVYRPEFGALLFLALVTGLPHSVLFDRGIPAFGGALKVTDLILAATLASWLAKAAVRRWQVMLPSGATTALVLLGIAASVVSILVAYGAPSKLALFELRPLLSYLLVFPIVSGIRSLRDIEVGLAAYLAATSVASMITVWRYAHGEGGTASYTNGAVRVVDSVLFTSALLALIWVAALAPTIRRTAVTIALAGLGVISLAALLFTFQRTGWVTLLVVVALLFLTRLGRGVRLRLVLRSVPVLIVGVVAIVVVNSRATHAAQDPLRAAVTRLASVADFNRDVSGQHRIHEWKAATHAIEAHPLAGIGLGNTITYWSPMYSPETHTMGGMTTTWYIHNSYIWFALKLGLAGAFAFVALLILQVVRARAALKGIRDVRRRRLILGGLVTLVALLIVSVTGPQLNEDFSTPYIAAVIALIELVPRIGARPRPRVFESHPGSSAA